MNNIIISANIEQFVSKKTIANPYMSLKYFSFLHIDLILTSVILE